MAEAIPVLMYHSVSPKNRSWVSRHLSLDPVIFEDHLRTLVDAGYTTICLSELYDYVAGRRHLPAKSIALTFDDGYLDNWVYVHPMLRKYGFRATVFVSTDFIDRRGHVRPTLEDVWSRRCVREALPSGGFLSAPEMRAMIESETVDVQAHCKTHTWHFTTKEIIDFHHPGDFYPWLAWNARPERKSLYMEEDQSEFVPFGSPVYTHDHSLVAHRYFPDTEIASHLVKWVASNGGREFFTRPQWRDLLGGEAERIGPGAGGRHEGDCERFARLREEIADSKRDLEQVIGKRVDFLCWPGGSCDVDSIAIAREAGYKAWTLAGPGPVNKANLPGEDPAWIRRVPAIPWWDYRGHRVSAVDGKFVRLIIEKYRGAPGAALKLKAYKANRLLRSYLKRAVGRMML